MRILIIFLILILSFQSWTKADDISEFEIEGMSIGDSLLNYFTKKEIINSIDKYQSDENYSVILITKNFKEYDAMELHFKTKDKNYVIVGMAGGLYYKNDFNKCLKKQKEVVQSIKTSFKFTNAPNYDEGSHPMDPSGNSKYYRYSFMISPKSKFFEIGISCFDFSNSIENKGYVDNFNIIIHNNEYNEYLSKL